ncbi:TetR/AcrR family transcriptional regulator [Devosia sp.]|uniref:TetR/AcrR family transcriptional regulator n=1 Tax=Devosia sp. TaxID=1871048 RepID=UPI00326510CF
MMNAPHKPDEIDENETGSSKGRTPAGQDPVKRDQILDGAKRCFMTLGFEAASMNEITKEAGVSKGTIYVYFENKEELFTALVDRERGILLDNAHHELEEGTSVADSLQRFGVSITTHLTSDKVMKAQRMVLGVYERMPQIALRFMGPDPFSAIAILQRYLVEKVASGALQIDDTELAARQFIELSMANTFKRRLFGNMPKEAPRADIERTVAIGVAMFLKFYGA